MAQVFLLEQRPARERVAGFERAAVVRDAGGLQGVAHLGVGPGAALREVEGLAIVQQGPRPFVIERIAADQALTQHMPFHENGQ